MLSTEQANSLADDIVQNERRESIELRNARARVVPFFLRSRALQALEPWQQAELLKRAERKANSDWRVVWFGLAWVALCLAAWWGSGKPSFRSAFPVAFFLLVGPVFWWRARLIRRELAALLTTASEGQNGEPEVYNGVTARRSDG